jgi:hypothetical protein
MREGFTLLKIPADPSLGESVASHPDTVMFCHGGELITTADYCDAGAYIFSDLREFRPNLRLIFTDDVRGPEYPCDCIMNALVIGDRIFCKTDTVSRAILDHASRKGLKVCHVNQGYPACVTLAFGNSAITADRGIAAELEKEGVKVTLISHGHISLSPYEYGFIGGASAVCGRRIYFFGDVGRHADAEAIIKAIEDEGFTPISLFDGDLCDLGGAILA